VRKKSCVQKSNQQFLKSNERIATTVNKMIGNPFVENERISVYMLTVFFGERRIEKPVILTIT
jgi:hypothetical protein